MGQKRPVDCSELVGRSVSMAVWGAPGRSRAAEPRRGVGSGGVRYGGSGQGGRTLRARGPRTLREPPSLTRAGGGGRSSGRRGPTGWRGTTAGGTAAAAATAAPATVTGAAFTAATPRDALATSGAPVAEVRRAGTRDDAGARSAF